MARLRDGEDLALNVLMNRWQKPLVSFIQRYIGSPTDALDLAQETFVRVYQARDRYRPEARFSSWLFSIATNLCKNHVRWESRHPSVTLVHSVDHDLEGPGDFTDSLAVNHSSPSDAAENNDLARCVRESIQKLPHDLKTTVLLFEYEDLSYDEIATILKCSPKAVETRLYRARKVLRDDLERTFSSSPLTKMV